MRNLLLSICLFVFLNTTAQAQIAYKGAIDKFPVELVIDDGEQDAVTGIYCYQKYHNPIQLTGSLNNGSLILYEKNKAGENTASFALNNFSGGRKNLEGTWTDLATKKELKVSLSFQGSSSGDGKAMNTLEVLQAASTTEYYFKTVVSKKADEEYPKVSAIKVLSKKDEALIQQITLSCDAMGSQSMDTGDFNFDGVTDISIYEVGHSGPNTTSQYYLFDPSAQKFSDSHFKGVSLEFDSRTRTVTERNSSAAGTEVTTTVFTVADNKMVFKDQHCFKWDEKKLELVERPWKDCQ